MIIGIDEAGRGPLAGPLAIGGVCCSDSEHTRRIVGVADSKQLTPIARDMWYRRIERLHNEELLRYAVVTLSPRYIDTHGMGTALRAGVKRLLKQLGAPHDAEILLDGSLYAPFEFIHQQTIIKGDVTEPIISAASIMAKVHRDRYMARIAKKYPKYGFEVHKGYGTQVHRDVIAKQGLCVAHRKSFCGSFVR